MNALRSRWLRWPLYLLYLLLVAELGARAFWRIEYDVPLWGATRDDWSGVFFDGFRRDAEIPPPLEDENALDVLLLGGSVLYHQWRHGAEELSEALERATGRPVRLVNHSHSGHTTRDSLLKYQRLEDQQFDLVIVYHGINDVRMNNAPPEMFRSDYTHASWYDKIALVDRSRPWASPLLLPLSLRYALIDMTESRFWKRYVPRHRPVTRWTRYGAEVKTRETFRENLEAIADLAASRGQRLLVGSFAWYLPDDYSYEAFREKRLDYGRHSHATEIWGEPRHVAKALEAHNLEIHELARRPDVLFADVERAMPEDREHFDDVCHLTAAGRAIFVDTVAPPVGQAFSDERRAAEAGGTSAGRDPRRESAPGPR